MQFNALRRTTTFRLTAIYCVVFSLGAVAMLGMIYLQSAVYLTRRVDGILKTEADALAQSPRDGLRRRISEELVLNGDRTNVFALFSADGTWLAGNLAALPIGLKMDGKPIEIAPTSIFPASARLIARRLPTGEILVTGRDVNQLRELRAIIASALIISGAVIIFAGIACAIAFSMRPLRRLRALQDAGEEIARGDLKRRMPLSGRHDELDMLAATVNTMIGEVERLMSEVKGATETIAHDLITPLTRASTQLHRMQQADQLAPDHILGVTAEIDEVLDRFRAILRISELEARGRRAGFQSLDLMDVIAPVIELYQPLAETGGIWLQAAGERGQVIQADPKLLIEALSNLIDNAIKFTGSGGSVQLRLISEEGAPVLIVEDNGPGIAVGERETVLQRFYRSDRNRLTPGSGLGLSIVAAITRLHGFELRLEDADPGLRVRITCQNRTLSY